MGLESEDVRELASSLSLIGSGLEILTDGGNAGHVEGINGLALAITEAGREIADALRVLATAIVSSKRED